MNTPHMPPPPPDDSGTPPPPPPPGYPSAPSAPPPSTGPAYGAPPPAYGYGAAPGFEQKPPRPDAKLGGGLIVAGAVLIAIGVYLPWIDDGGSTRSGTDLFFTSDGEIFDGPGNLMLAISFVLAGLGIALFFAGRVLAVAIIALSALAPVLHPRGVLRKVEAYEQRASAALSGTTAPAIPFVRSVGLGDGGAGSLAPGGEPTLINFWATWCGPCVDELPMIERFWKDHRDSGLKVVGVTKLYDGPDADAEAQQIREFLDGRGVTFPVVIADEDSPSHAAYGVESLPSSVLVDRHGTVIAFGAGVRGTVRLMRLAEERAGASYPDPD